MATVPRIMVMGAVLAMAALTVCSAGAEGLVAVWLPLAGATGLDERVVGTGATGDGPEA
jgi:hypothetical protein